MLPTSIASSAIWRKNGWATILVLNTLVGISIQCAPKEVCSIEMIVKPGANFLTVGEYDPETQSRESCIASCASSTIASTIIGMFGDGVCLCGQSLPLTLAAPTDVDCNGTCADPNANEIGCGAVIDANSTKVPIRLMTYMKLESADSGGALTELKYIDFNASGLAYYQMDPITVVTLKNFYSNTPPEKMYYYIGNEEVGSWYTDLGKVALKVSLNLPISSELRIRVKAVLFGKEIWKEKFLKLGIQYNLYIHHCDVVAEPGVEYGCSVAVLGGGIVPSKFSLGSSSASTLRKMPESPVVAVGHPPPRGQHENETTQAPVNSTTPQTFLFKTTPVEELVQIWSLDGYAVAPGPITLKILRPLCTGFYDAARALCLDAAPGQLQVNSVFRKELTCTDVFDVANGACSYDGSFSEAAEYALVQSLTFTATAAGHFALPVPAIAWAMPGTMFAVTLNNCLLRNVSDGGEGDVLLNDDLTFKEVSNFQCLMNVKTIRPQMYDIMNTCDNSHAASNVAFIMDAAKVNTTACQYSILGLSLTKFSSVTPQPPGSHPIYYARKSEIVGLITSLQRGKPVYYTIEWGDTIIDDLHFNNTNGGQQVFKHGYQDIGNHTVTLSAYNLHSEPLYGRIGYKTNFSIYILVQEPVTNVTMRIENSWIDSSGEYPIYLECPTAYLPTDASVFCDYADDPANTEESHTVELSSLDSTVEDDITIYNISHHFMEHGVYNVTCRLWNKVSDMWIGVDEMIYWYYDIVDFEVIPKYIPLGFDLATYAGLDGMGAKKNMFPKDLNVTFFFNYKQGTIEQIRVRNVTNGTDQLLGLYQVPDIRDAKSYRIHIQFPKEALYNISFEAKNNRTDWKQFNVTFVSVGLVSGLEVDDGRNISDKNVPRNFTVTFLTIGAGTCLYVDYGDNYERTMGDAKYCKTWKPGIIFDKSIERLQPKMIIQHTYTNYGIYRVKAEAHNLMTKVVQKYEFLTVISKGSCRPPRVEMVDGVNQAYLAKEFLRKEIIVLQGAITVDCDDVLTTNKTWRIYRVNASLATGEEEILEEVKVSEIAPTTYNRSKLLINQRALSYGMYKAYLAVRMWDESPLDPSLTHLIPFITETLTYFTVIRSPLVASLISGPVSKVTRGNKQKLLMEPYALSYDPDTPELKFRELKFTWFCRHINESLPTDNRTGTVELMRRIKHKIPRNKLENTTLGGCFGTGPGALDVDGGVLEISTEIFVQPETEYEFYLEVSKDVRLTTTSLRMFLLKGVPPLPVISCSDPSLCFMNSKGNFFFNPTARLGIRSSCSLKEGSDCTSPLESQWGVEYKDEEANLTVNANMTDPNYFAGCSGTNENPVCGSDLAIKPLFFTEVPKKNYVIFIAMSNGASSDSKGVTRMDFYMNQPPISGSCNFIAQNNRSLDDLTSLVDALEFSCEDWVDPEGIGIASFSIFRSDARGKQELVSTVDNFVKPVVVRLEVGTWTFHVNINDKWGAFTSFNLNDTVVVNMPNVAQLQEATGDKAIEKLVSQGDSSGLATLISAQVAVEMNNLESGAPVGDPAEVETLGQMPQGEAKKKIAEIVGQNKIKAMEAVKEIASTVSDPQTIEMFSNLLNTVIGKKSKSGPSSVGLQVQNDAIAAAQALTRKMHEFKEGFPTPEEVINVATPIVEMLGNVLDLMLGGDKDSDNACDNISPVDKANADKPGMEYETDLGDDYNLVIPSDPSLQKCGGISSSTKDSGSDNGNRIMGMVQSLAYEMLSRSVIGESYSVNSDTITILTHLMTGEDLKKPILVNGWDIRFPQNFCLGPSYDGECNTPAGLTVIEYLTNPRPDGLFSNRLAEDTQLLDIRLSNIVHNPAPVANIFMPNSTVPGIRFVLKRTNPPNYKMVKYNITEYFKHKRQKMAIHMIPMPKADTTLTIDIAYADDEVGYLTLLLSHEKIPTYKKFEFAKQVNTLKSSFSREGYTFSWFLGNDDIKNRTDSRWFLSIVNLSNSLTEEEMKAGKFSADKIVKLENDYKLMTYTAGCYFLDENLDIWSGDGLIVEEVDLEKTVCRTHHLTTFATGFDIQPNGVEFDFHQPKIDFKEDIFMYSVVILILIVGILFMLWAIYKDNMDCQATQIRPLLDNRPQDKYLYQMLVLTGAKNESACKSKIYFVINGEANETDIREFPSGEDGYFKRGGIDHFLLRVKRPLGNLNFIRLWHDNSGAGSYASWFLSGIVVRDLQTNEQFQFVAGRWMAVEKDDGKIDIVVPVTGNEISFFNTYHQKIENNTRQNHLWISPFLRPKCSRYTRKERVGCLMAYMFSILLVISVWYFMVEDYKSQVSYSLGPLYVTEEDILVGLATCFISTPLVALLSYIFKYSRRTQPQIRRREDDIPDKKVASEANNDCHDYDEDYDYDYDNDYDDGNKVEAGEVDKDDGERGNNGSARMDGDNDDDLPHDFSQKAREMNKWRHKTKLLPNAMIWVAWAVIVILILASWIFTWTAEHFMANFNKTKWLTSVCIATAISFFIFEPLKVLFLTCLTHFCCWLNLDDDLDDLMLDEESRDVVADPSWSSTRKIRKRLVYRPYPEEYLEALRKGRLKEIRNQNFTLDLLTFLLFIAALVIVSVENRDPASFQLKSHLEQRLVRDHGLDQVKNSDDFWRWVYGVTKELKAGPLYNGEPPYGYRGFVGDHTQRIIGYATLRQIRVKRHTCRVAPLVQDITTECSGDSQLLYEEEANFCGGWTEMTEFNAEFTNCKRTEFHYQTATDLKGMVIRGWRDSYNGGGYVIKVKGRSKAIEASLRASQEQHWINNHTRAVLLEFGMYNTGLNLFSVNTLGAEWMPGGGATPYWRIDIIRLITFWDFFGTLSILSFYLLAIFYLYFAKREIEAIMRKRRSYFRSYFSLVEWGIILSGFAMVGFKFWKYMETQDMLEIFARTYGNGYIKMQYVSLIDEIYGYIIGFLLFMSILKLLKILEFNVKISMLNVTMSRCWGELSSFLVVFLAIFFAFVQAFYFMLHADLAQFRNMLSTTCICFTMLLNKFDFSPLREASYIGSVVFFVFASLMNTLMVNVLITVIMDGYAVAKEELEHKKNELEVVQYMKNVSLFFIGKGPRPCFEDEFTKGFDVKKIVEKKSKIKEDKKEENEDTADLVEVSKMTNKRLDDLMQVVRERHSKTLKQFLDEHLESEDDSDDNSSCGSESENHYEMA